MHVTIVKNIKSMTNCKSEIVRAGLNLKRGPLNQLNRSHFVLKVRFLTIVAGYPQILQ